MVEVTVKASALAKNLRGGEEVDGVTFEAYKGEILVLLGSEGSGKTSILRMLDGTVRPTSGSAKVLGLDPADPKDAAQLKLRVSVLGQTTTAFWRLTVKENLEFFAGVYGNTGLTPKLLDSVGLGPLSGTRFYRLSVPDRRRVGFAISLANDPEVVLADEPGSGAETEAERVARTLVRNLAKEGKTVILATSSPGEAQLVGDRIGVVAHGRLAALDAPSRLIASYGRGKDVIFKGGGDSAFGTLRRLFDNVSMEATDVVLPFENIRDLEVALRELVGRGIAAQVEVRTSTLDDLLRKLMDDSGEEGKAG